MTFEDYADYGVRQLNMDWAGLESIGTLTLLHSDTIVDAIIGNRMAVIARAIDHVYRTDGDDAGLNAEQHRQLLTYEQYLVTIKSMDSIRLKLSEAEGKKVRMAPGRTGNDLEDKYYAKAMEKKFGYNPTADWKKADKIIEAQRKLYAQYDATTLQFARSFNPTTHTPDRAGFFKFVNERDPDLIEMLLKTIPVTPLLSELRRHAYITGGSGSGKTELLKQLIHASYHRPDEAVIVIDPHGDMVQQIAQWEYFLGDENLVYIDPYLSEDQVPPFNPLIVPEGTSMQQKEVIASQLVNAFEQLLKGSGGDSLTVNMRTVLTPCLLTLLDRPGSTLADLQRFMNDRLNAKLVELGTRSKRRAIRDFFAYAFLEDTSLKQSKSAISRKLQSLFNTFAFDEVVNSTTTLDLEGMINEGKIILFNLSKGRMGEEASEAFGRLIVAAIQGLALRRADTPEEHRVPINLYIDECQNYIAPATMQILEEARKYGVSLTLAQQVVGRGMSSEMQSVVLNNTNIKVAGRTPEDDKMAKILGKTQADVQALETGQFWMKVGNGGTFKLKAGSDLIGDNIAMSPTQWAVVQAEQLARYRFLAEGLPDPDPTAESEPEANAADDGAPMPWPRE